MRIIHRVIASLHIRGIYGWGVGYLNAEYPSRWAVMCAELAKKGPYPFQSATMTAESYGSCETFVSNGLYAYMHPMEIALERTSSQFCPSENEGTRFLEDTRKMLETLISDFVRPAFPEVEIHGRMVIRDYEIDLDDPHRTIDNNF